MFFEIFIVCLLPFRAFSDDNKEWLKLAEKKSKIGDDHSDGDDDHSNGDDDDNDDDDDDMVLLSFSTFSYFRNFVDISIEIFLPLKQVSVMEFARQKFGNLEMLLGLLHKQLGAPEYSSCVLPRCVKLCQDF